jgi:hypothetical protein
MYYDDDDDERCEGFHDYVEENISDADLETRRADAARIPSADEVFQLGQGWGADNAYRVACSLRPTPLVSRWGDPLYGLGFDRVVFLRGYGEAFTRTLPWYRKIATQNRNDQIAAGHGRWYW